MKGFYEVSYFDVQVKEKLDLDNNKYIRFSSYQNSKILFKFYKEEVCQGGKPSKGSVIKDTGFFDSGNQHWTQFEPFVKRIVYQHSINENGLIELTPLHIRETYNLDNSGILDL
jgi:hypothetical protein